MLTTQTQLTPAVDAVTDAALPPAPPQTIDDIMAAVAADIARVGVGKTGTNSQQGYKFRPIDEVLNTVGPIMARHGLAMTVEFDNRTAERIPTKSGGFMTSVVMTGTFCYRWRGDSRVTVTIGEATDAGDKAGYKAMAMAAKYAHVLTFGIPIIGSDDADAANGAKTLNDARDKSSAGGRMSDPELREWSEELARAKTRPDMQAVIKDALAKADEYGDVAAHDKLRAAAADLWKRLPA